MTGRAAVLVLAAAGLLPAASSFRAGVAALDITPKGPIWMSGYASRNKPSEGVAHPLYAKALALEDAKGQRAVIVTTDLIGLPRAISDEVAARVLKQYNLPRAALLLNSSHTHTGPVVRPNLSTMYDLPPADQETLAAYARDLTGKLVTVVGAALGKLEPARLSVGHGQVGFAMNRREFTPKGVRLGVNPQGPTDHDVPVLKAESADGKLLAVLFGYACHNTTLTGQFYKISGDYAGYAQSEVEKAHPGATALFVMLCGGDQNPEPRSQEELAITHGRALAAEVGRVLTGAMKPVEPRIRTAFRIIELEFAHHSRETFEAELKSDNPHRRRRAAAMLAAYDQRRPVRRTPYPVQAIRLGRNLTVLGLGGEVVVGYQLRVKKEFPREDVIAAGYSNDVMCYIPTRQILSEGGYEPNDSMVYYGMPGPFAGSVEETLFAAIRQTLGRVGVK